MQLHRFELFSRLTLPCIISLIVNVTDSSVFIGVLVLLSSIFVVIFVVAVIFVVVVIVGYLLAAVFAVVILL